jgi:enamine deaminase RidA (YjgF/YER057c/UK114 family)
MSGRPDESLLPTPTEPGGRYRTVLVHEGLAYVSGHLPKVAGEIVHTGKVGADCSIEDARAAARASALSCLASLRAALGSLAAIERVLKVTGFVASAEGFNAQGQVVDAASDLLIEWLGVERGEHARSSIGVYQLPRNAPVEIEMVCAVRRP